MSELESSMVCSLAHSIGHETQSQGHGFEPCVGCQTQLWAFVSLPQLPDKDTDTVFTYARMPRPCSQPAHNLLSYFD